MTSDRASRSFRWAEFSAERIDRDGVRSDPASLVRRLPLDKPGSEWLRQTTTRWLMADSTLESVTAALAGIPWLLLKGGAVGTIDYPVRELRTLSDIDILIEPRNLDESRRRLEEAGWRLLRTDDRRAADYRRRHGYCLQMQRPGELLLEVHFRLWGSLPDDASRDLVNEFLHSPTTPPPLFPSAPFRYVMAAVHGWMSEQTEPLRWWDLEWIASGSEALSCERFREQIAELSKRWDVQLPVFLAAHRCGAGFGTEVHATIAGTLQRSLRFPERVFAASTRRPTHRSIEAARFLARRRSRGGSNAIVRRLWPHPHQVASTTSETSPWWRRRLASQIRLVRSLWRRPENTPPTGAR